MAVPSAPAGRSTPALTALEGAVLAFAVAGFAWLGLIYLRMLVSPAPQEMREGALIVTTLALAPLTLLFDNQRSFDDLAGMSQDIESVQGFKTVEEAFSSGEVLP
ncbi:MAG: hypothetical protein ACK4ST_05540, partial [Elioraea tepidiphila]